MKTSASTLLSELTPMAERSRSPSKVYLKQLYF